MAGRSVDKTLFLIRHCKAAGQEPGAPLTPEGRVQAEALAGRLAGCGIERVVASPFVRAVETARPLARRLGLPVETDPRLVERVLSGTPRPDWLERLRESFADPDLKLEGGESAREATARSMASVNELMAAPARVTAVVAHGNLLALILGCFDAGFGFEQWQAMSNPAVYRVEVRDGGATVRTD